MKIPNQDYNNSTFDQMFSDTHGGTNNGEDFDIEPDCDEVEEDDDFDDVDLY